MDAAGAARTVGWAELASPTSLAAGSAVEGGGEREEGGGERPGTGIRIPWVETRGYRHLVAARPRAGRSLGGARLTTADRLAGQRPHGPDGRGCRSGAGEWGIAGQGRRFAASPFRPLPPSLPPSPSPFSLPPSPLPLLPSPLAPLPSPLPLAPPPSPLSLLPSPLPSFFAGTPLCSPSSNWARIILRSSFGASDYGHRNRHWNTY